MARQKQSGRAAKSTKSEGEENRVRREGEELEAALAEARAMLKAAPKGQPAGREYPPEVSVEAGNIIRPEQFYHPEVSGITVPVTTMPNGELVTRWRVHLSYPDGTRDFQDLGKTIRLPTGTNLLVNPMPTDPDPDTPCGWSPGGREDWYTFEQPVIPANLFKGVCHQIRQYVEFPRKVEEGTVATVALWVVLTYVFRAWDAVPYLHLHGPKNSGKTRVLEVLKQLVFRPLYSAKFSPSSVFRSLHANGGTLLYDEAERLKEGDLSELRTLFLVGYQKSGTHTVNIPKAGSDWDPKSFKVYGPKVLACIAGLDDTLASRCIRIAMRKAGAGAAGRRRVDDKDENWKWYRDGLHNLALTYGQDWLALAGKEEVCPDGIHNRDFQLWQPLLALARWFEEKGVGGLVKLMEGHALATIAAGKDEQVREEDEVLLQALTLARINGTAPTPGAVLAVARKERPDLFADWHPRRVSTCLAAYDLKTRRGNRGRCYETPLRDLYDIQESYGFDLQLTEDVAGAA